jgi:hypothetical protein
VTGLDLLGRGTFQMSGSEGTEHRLDRSLFVNQTIMVFPASISNKMLSTRLERAGFTGCFSDESGGGAAPREPEDSIEAAARAHHSGGDRGLEMRRTRKIVTALSSIDRVPAVASFPEALRY